MLPLRCGLVFQRILRAFPTRFFLGVDVGPCIGEPLADDTLKALNGPLAVVHAVGDAVIVAELELGKVAV